MTHATVTALIVLMLTACSPQLTRYDLKDTEVASVNQPFSAEDKLYAAGFEAIRAKDFVGAEGPLRQLLETKPDDSYALLAMGAVMEGTDRPDEAVTYYRRAALYGETASLGEILSLDPASATKPRTVRDIALMNMARLR